MKLLVTEWFGWGKFSCFKYKDIGFGLRSGSKKKSCLKLQKYSGKTVVLHYSLDINK